MRPEGFSLDLYDMEFDMCVHHGMFKFMCPLRLSIATADCRRHGWYPCGQGGDHHLRKYYPQKTQVSAWDKANGIEFQLVCTARVVCLVRQKKKKKRKGGIATKNAEFTELGSRRFRPTPSPRPPPPLLPSILPSTYPLHFPVYGSPALVVGSGQRRDRNDNQRSSRSVLST